MIDEVSQPALPVQTPTVSRQLGILGRDFFPISPGHCCQNENAAHITIKKRKSPELPLLLQLTPPSQDRTFTV
jgi:hypothetical protein